MLFVCVFCAVLATGRVSLPRACFASLQVATPLPVLMEVLVCLLALARYGAWDRLKLQVRRAEQFPSLPPSLPRLLWAELQRRCDTLIRLIERENAEVRGKKGAGASAVEEVEEEDGDEEGEDDEAPAGAGSSKVRPSDLLSLLCAVCCVCLAWV